VPGHSIVIADPTTLREFYDGEVGEILIQGPSVTQGYWDRPEETEQEFAAQVEGREGRFLRTGDLGFFRDGELYVTGRVKDVIIIRGRNHYPQDIEQSAEEAHPAVLAGAAFALEDASGERLVVVHQIDRQHRSGDHQQIIQAIRRSIVEHHELDPYAIVLIRQTSLPITSSGKVQRNLCREQYLADKLRVVHSWINPAVNRHAGPASPNGRVYVQMHDAGVSVSRGAEQAVATFAEFGVDSLTAVELSHELEVQFHVPLPPIVAWNYPTPAALARYLAEQSLGVGEANASRVDAASSAADSTKSSDEAQLAALLAEVENLSDDDAARLLSKENRQN
jgi:acyl carrier protein